LASRVDVIALGNINIDLAFYVDAAPAHDAEVFAHRFSRFHGGSAANFSAGVAKLGLRSGILACVGNDLDGEEAIDALRGEGVITEFIRRVDDAVTGTVCVIVEGDGSRRMIAYRGANALLERIAEEGMERASLSSRMVQLCNVSRNVLKRVMRHGGGWKVSVDPGGSVGELEVEDLDGASIVLLNESECETLTGEGWSDGARMLSESVKRVVVKRGADGAHMISAGREYTLPAYKVDVQDTTGAGDAFDAGFISACCRGLAEEECLRWGLASAAVKIQSKGARNGLATEVQLREFLRHHERVSTSNEGRQMPE